MALEQRELLCGKGGFREREEEEIEVFGSASGQRFFSFRLMTLNVTFSFISSLLTSTRHSSTSLSLKPRRAASDREGYAAGVARATAASSPGDDAIAFFFSLFFFVGECVSSTWRKQTLFVALGRPTTKRHREQLRVPCYLLSPIDLPIERHR